MSDRPTADERWDTPENGPDPRWRDVLAAVLRGPAGPVLLLAAAGLAAVAIGGWLR